MGGIKANELRIGNWVKLDKYFYRVYSVNPLENKLIDKDKIIISGWYVDGIQPIPLTEEILFKCDECKWHSTKWYIVKIGSIIVSVNTKTKTTTITDDYTDEVMLNIKCEYLHQLQNIVHSLTHEELNIEL